MNQQDAAAFLEITPQMLRYYTKQKRIRAQVDPAHKRRTLAYDQADLARFKAELAQPKPWQARVQEPGQGTPQTTPQTTPQAGESLVQVRFALDTHYLERLTEAGAKYGMTPHQYARHLVIDALEGRLETTLQQLRDDLAAATLALLISPASRTRRTRGSG